MPYRGLGLGAINLTRPEVELPTTGIGTWFKAIWDDDASTLYVAIFCQDPNAANLNIGSIRNGVDGIFLGDLVEIHLETQNHAYYQLVINPAGELVGLDRRDDKNWDWSSGAQAAAHVGAGFWSVEIRIPVITASERDLDPNGDGVAGFRPSHDMPWYINVCRQRIRSGGNTDWLARSPTGKPAFHDCEKLGRFYVGGRRPEVIQALKAQEQRARELERAERETSGREPPP